MMTKKKLKIGKQYAVVKRFRVLKPYSEQGLREQLQHAIRKALKVKA